MLKVLLHSHSFLDFLPLFYFIFVSFPLANVDIVRSFKNLGTCSPINITLEILNAHMFCAVSGIELGQKSLCNSDIIFAA